MISEHSHAWVPNTHDGKPRFSFRMGAELSMPVRCCECGESAWITRDGWDSMCEAAEAGEGK